MKITLWGTRGSLACSGPESEHYGGNTSCVEIRNPDNTFIILDAGTGIRRLGLGIDDNVKRIDIFLTHLHLDHIQGLGFFAPLYNEDVEVHIYGPSNSSRNLRDLLTKYFSPPLFPVLLQELPCKLFLHEVPGREIKIGELTISSDIVCHPGLTLGYRISSPTGSVAYLPDHEPALGMINFPQSSDWTSGYYIASNVDLLLHDSQYTQDEYEERIGWGHSSIIDSFKFAQLAKAKTLVTFHHDPAHSDIELDRLLAEAVDLMHPDFKVVPGREGSSFIV